MLVMERYPDACVLSPVHLGGLFSYYTSRDIL